MQPPKDDRTLGELFAELSRDTTTLMRKEMELARAELSAKASRIGRHATYIAVGGAIAYAGALTLVWAAVIILATIGLAWWAASLIVGIAVALIGYLLVQRGMSALQHDSIAPTETIETMKENAAWAKGQRT